MVEENKYNENRSVTTAFNVTLNNIDELRKKVDILDDHPYSLYSFKGRIEWRVGDIDILKAKEKVYNDIEVLVIFEWLLLNQTYYIDKSNYIPRGPLLYRSIIEQGEDAPEKK